jgi:hypothetical protein
MGVMSCSRPDCPQIMCDFYVDGIGHICHECQREFQDYLEKEGLNPSTEGEIKNELKKFMATDKGKYEKGKEMTVTEFFKQYDRHN